MTFDWDEFQKLSNDEKAAYMKRAREAAFEASKDDVFAPGDLGLEKGQMEEGLKVVGRMKPDGTVHYYTDEEKRAKAERAKRLVEDETRARSEGAERDDSTGEPPA